jgi:hypothetical protein
MIGQLTREHAGNGTAPSRADRLVAELEQDGIVLLPELLSKEQLAGMQRAFALRLRRLRWNDFDGYQKTERYRHMVQDVLALDQGFVDAALHPLVKEVIRRYVGDGSELVEAKGWKSLPTKRDFHGWHGDAWYDQERVKDHIPREVKLAIYLTDVKSGAFKYIKGSHGKQAPRPVGREEVQDVPPERVVEVLGPAGSAFLFDTSGVHRQSAPILQERHAVFLNYHDPGVPLQKEDVEYYRYHPLLLNAAFLGGLDDEDRRILGFGNKTHYNPAFERERRHTWFQAFMRRSYDLKLFVGEMRQRFWGKLKRLLRLGRK